MKLSEVRRLLSENDISYTLTIESSRREFYGKKGFRTTEDTGTFYLLTIRNPHHSKNIEIIFADSSDNPEFYDLGFGGYWYEMFGWMEEELPQGIMDEIQNILNDKSWVIFATDAQNGTWFFDGIFCDTEAEEWNDMESFHKTINRIKNPKNLWRKIIGRMDCYEIFNWTKYEKIIK